MHGLTKPTGHVNVETLRVERQAIYRRAQALTAERAELALSSVLGDTKAAERIADIDAERVLCASRVELLEQAIASLQKQEQQTGWRKHLPNLERALHAELVDTYRNCAGQLNRLMLGRQPHDIRDLKRALEEFERIEHDTAKMIADRILPQARMPAHIASDQADLNRARAEHAKLVEQRNQNITEATRELAASITVKRPASLVEALARARQRIEVGG
jgi:hypothetical protein